MQHAKDSGMFGQSFERFHMSKKKACIGLQIKVYVVSIKAHQTGFLSACVQKEDDMKKLISFAASLAMLVALAGCGNSSAKGVSGTFTGTAIGMGGKDKPVEVTITLEDSKITDVIAKGEGETEGIGSKAIEAMPVEMKKTASIAVDGISGATITSKAILEAAAAAITSAGLDPKNYQTGTADDTASAGDVTKDADVVIVGAGGAGMTAAIKAADAGKKVVIVESQSMAGGNSVRATGGMNAAKTKYQDENTFGEDGLGVEVTLKNAREKYADNADIQALADTVEKQYQEYQATSSNSYFDSVELFELDTLIGGQGINDVSLVQTLAENSASAIDWLETIGAELHNVGQFGGASVKRIHRPVNAEGKVTAVGAYLVPILEKNCEDRGVEILYNTTADTILTNAQGEVCGIEAKTTDGAKVTVNAKTVILTTGGFGANNEMVVEQNHPELKGYITTNAPGAQGQGIVMAQAVGAGTVDMEQIQLHPTVHVDADGNAHLITEGLRGDGAILVNKEGNRFFNEVGTRDAVSNAENSQTDGQAWLVIDQAMVDQSAVIAGYINAGYTVTGQTYEELAQAMGIPEENLVKTMDTWNQAVAAQADPEFDRIKFAEPLNTAPYYAILVQPGIHHTMGGLTVDTTCAVLDGVHGKAIPGLYAAGEVTGGLHGANRLGGNAVADFIVFGGIAGESAAAYSK